MSDLPPLNQLALLVWNITDCLLTLCGCRLLPAYASRTSAARAKRHSLRSALHHRLIHLTHLLPVIALALLIVTTQLGYKYAALSTKLSRTRAPAARADQRGYGLAMRVAWLEEALLLVNATALTCECMHRLVVDTTFGTRC